MCARDCEGTRAPSEVNEKRRVAIQVNKLVVELGLEREQAARAHLKYLADECKDAIDRRQLVEHDLAVRVEERLAHHLRNQK